MDKPQLEFKLVTPSAEKAAIKVDEVSLPGEKGYFGVLPGHTPFLTRIGIGEVMYRIGDKKHYLAISGGFAEVSDDVVIVLARAAELPDEIDKERAEKSRERAEKRLSGKDYEIDFTRAQTALQRSLIRLRIADFSAN